MSVTVIVTPWLIIVRRLVNVAGIVGPTHHYGGLATGNVASYAHRYQTSYPRCAALQSLERMCVLDRLGVRQLIVPPLTIQAPFFSASAMWMANAATVISSQDTFDGRVHLIPANLQSHSHRQQECIPMSQLLQDVFSDEQYFKVCKPLTSPDEGSANHIILGEHHFEAHVFLGVYGGRQSKDAILNGYSDHIIDQDRVVVALQQPDAIAQGVFHNDVIAVGSAGLLVVHEGAYVDQQRVISSLAYCYESQYNEPLTVITVTHEQLTIAEAVNSYLFNSQLLYLDGRYVLIAPLAVQQSNSARLLVEGWVSDSACLIDAVEYVDLGQSMNNGGGPACLRLKLLLSEQEWGAISDRFYFDRQKYDFLKGYINQYYPEVLVIDQLKNEFFIAEMTQCVVGLYDWFGLNDLLALSRNA